MKDVTLVIKNTKFQGFVFGGKRKYGETRERKEAKKGRG